MRETICKIDGIMYKLKYMKKNTLEGEEYKGILFLNNAFGFSYTVKDDKMISFDPSFADAARKNAIMKAIEESSKR